MQQEQSLTLNLTQHLAMTMKLQQAIQILQLSAQELKTEIEKEYLENPALEIEYTNTEVDTGSDVVTSAASLADYLGDENFGSGYSEATEKTRPEIAAPVNRTLETELLEQVKLTFRDKIELKVATFLVGSLNTSGYLTVSLTAAATLLDVDLVMVEKVLEQIQSFEPVGVGARDLAECLRLQALRQGIYDGLVANIIDKHLSLVADNQLKEIAVIEKCRPAEVQLAVDIVRKLEPKPGSVYSQDNALYIVPDVVVKKIDGSYKVFFNDNYVPTLHIAKEYRQLETYDKKTQKYIAGKLSAATWLLNSIEQRRQTIIKVVEEIVRVQCDFLDKGMAYLRPLTMKDVAMAIGVHESTVSRAVANKYVDLPQGIMALRKFFTANLAKNNSDEDFVANQAKAVISDLIKNENPQKPLSDQKICSLLQAKNMVISRRTVMKYREQLGFPSSVKRKRY